MLWFIVNTNWNTSSITVFVKLILHQKRPNYTDMLGRSKSPLWSEVGGKLYTIIPSHYLSTGTFATGSFSQTLTSIKYWWLLHTWRKREVIQLIYTWIGFCSMKSSECLSTTPKSKGMPSAPAKVLTTYK